MRVKRLSSLFCAVAFCGTASVAMAGAYGEAEQAEEMPHPAPAVAETATVEEFQPYAYLSLGGSYGKEFFEQSARQINNSYGWGVIARFGYRFTPNIAVELNNEDMIEFDGDSGDNRNPHKSNIDRAVYSIMPALKIFPIEGFAEPYILIGGGLVIADDGYNNRIARHENHKASFLPVTRQPVDDGMGFGMRFGIGADFYATNNIFITPEVAYILPLTSNVATYDYVSASLSIGYAFR